MKAYVQYFDWKTFEDYETWAMNSALGYARLFGNNMEYKFLKKVNINGVEYYQFSWVSNGVGNDSFICVNIKRGKAYLLYPDGKFVDYETWAKQVGK